MYVCTYCYQLLFFFNIYQLLFFSIKPVSQIKLSEIAHLCTIWRMTTNEYELWWTWKVRKLLYQFQPNPQLAAMTITWNSWNFRNSRNFLTAKFRVPSYRYLPYTKKR